MTFGVLLLGFVLGLLFVAPPGPVAVTLVEIGVTQGRRAGVRSAIGIAAGDVVVAAAAAILIGAGGAVSDDLMAGVRMFSSIALLGVGALLLTRPATVEAVAGSIRRPGRALFAMTVLTPTVFAAWVTMIAALPFATDAAAITGFIVGLALASMLWHGVIGALAAELGRRVHGPAMQWIARGGGVAMVALGLATLAI
ncbi:MAG: LysE family transporter [Actinomycetota bacterium]